MWAPSSGKFLSFKKANTDKAGNAYPTGTSHTVTGLPEGIEYKVRVRARYGEDKAGPFSELATTTISSTPQPTSAPAAEAPAKPTGLITGASHHLVLLSWTNPDDDSITGYQVLRGADAASLSVLADDTGSAAATYTDNSVAAETTYVYAVRARNANGLSPQSDPVTATTLAAPYPPPQEPGIARAIAGAEFTLGDQRLDTGGSCSEDDVTAITSGCTVNVELNTRFEVDGTLDSNDRLTVKTGRNRNNLTEHADQNDLRGTDQGVDLTFLPGRNLLRVWGDEDESSGGGEEYFFRVNVVPVWSLGGEQLSKSSDCRSSTTRAASDITHSDCIVEIDPSAPSFRIKDLLAGQYEVYVSVNSTVVIDNPGTIADLIAHHPLAFQDGDNVLRVRLENPSSEVAEVFGSDAFYYKITVRSGTLVSNMGQTDGTTAPLTDTTHYAQQFTTGSETNGYELAAVVVNIRSDPAGTFAFAIHENQAGEPGTKVVDLNGSPSEVGQYAFTPASPTTLDPLTAYFVVFKKTTAGRTNFIPTDSDAEDAGAAANWSIGDGSLGSTDSGANWVARTASMKIAIKGSVSSAGTGPPVASISAVNNTIFENTKMVEFDVNLNKDAPAGGINVRVMVSHLATYAVSPLAPGQVRTHTVNIPAEQRTGRLTLQPINNTLVSNDKTVVGTVQSGTGYTVSSTASANVVVQDDDTVTLEFSIACDQTYTVRESAGQVSYRLVITGGPVEYALDVITETVSGTAVAVDDYVHERTTNTFQARTRSVTGTVDIVNDTALEPGETFKVRVLSDQLPANVNVMNCPGDSDPTATVTITDEDIVILTLSFSGDEVVEGNPITVKLEAAEDDPCDLAGYTLNANLTVSGATTVLNSPLYTGDPIPVELVACGNLMVVTGSTRAEPEFETHAGVGEGTRTVTFTLRDIVAEGHATELNQRIRIAQRSKSIRIIDDPCT